MDYSKQVFFFSHFWDTLSLGAKMVLNFRLVSIFVTAWNIPDGRNTEILFFQSIHRADYDLFCQSIYGVIQSDKFYISVQRKARINLDFLSCSKEYLHIWRSIKEGSLSKKIYIFLSVVQVVSIRRKLVNYNTDCVVVHAEMLPVESYIVQYFKSFNKKTVTLQHGLYVDYSSDRNINEVNYSGVVSDVFLSWGEETKALIERFNPAVDVVVCGHPLLQRTKPSTDSRFFTVIFDQELFKDYNQILLDIAIEIAAGLNLRVNIRLHPKNNLGDYRLDCSRIVFDENPLDSSFVLGHTSTYMFELMRLGVPTFKISSPIPSVYVPPEIIFSSSKELGSLLSNVDDIDFGRLSSQYIGEIGEQALELYANTIDGYSN